MSRLSAPAKPRSKPASEFWIPLLLDRLHRLFAIVIVLQLIQTFRDYWWWETYAVIYGVLGVTAVIELLFTRLTALRLVLEAAAAILLSAYYSPFFEWSGWPSHLKSQAEWSVFYDSHIASLHPFVELAAGAMLAVHLFAWIGRSRGPMIALLIGSVGVMATVDSFFPLELWHNIAWIVAAGLGWLVVIHLRELRARHPDSWEALSERPIELALPAVIVIALLLISGIAMPRAPALLEDPYTLWSEAQGKEVPSLAGEGGVLSNSLGSGGSGASASSGYARDDRNIGGGFNFDYSPVMTVEASRRSYWRGESKTVYTGKGWNDSKQEDPVPFALDSPLKPNGRPDGVKTEKITQKVTFLRKDKIPVLFGAGPISKVTALDSDDNAGMRWSAQDWELKWKKPTKVRAYSVESEVTLFDRKALEGVQMPNARGGSASIDLAPYLQLPDSLPDRVRELAAQVTAQGKSEFDKAEMLERYLKDTYKYNNKPDVKLQKSKDVVDAFLFEIKEGYCDYYSTAFVVMARSVGIPARWVKGYASGYDPAKVDQMRYAGYVDDPDGAGTYMVRNADAHSWAEVYFEGYGWIPFEPTAGFSVPQPAPSDAAPAPDLSTEGGADEPQVTEGKGFAVGWQLPVFGGAALAAAAALFLLRKRRGVMLWRRIRYAGSTPEQRIVRETERLLKFMKRRGLSREPHETMRETFTRWGNKFASLRPDFDGILNRFERARYGKGPENEADARDFEAAVERLRKAL